MLIPTTFDDVRSCAHCGKAIRPGSVAFLSVVTSGLKGFGECDKAFHGVCFRIAEQRAAGELHHKEGPMKLVKAIEESMHRQLKTAGKALKAADKNSKKGRTVKPEKATSPKPAEGEAVRLTLRVPGSHKNRVQKWLKAEGIKQVGTRTIAKGEASYVVETGRPMAELTAALQGKFKIKADVVYGGPMKATS